MNAKATPFIHTDEIAQAKFAVCRGVALLLKTANLAGGEAVHGTSRFGHPCGLPASRCRGLGNSQDIVKGITLLEKQLGRMLIWQALDIASQTETKMLDPVVKLRDAAFDRQKVMAYRFGESPELPQGIDNHTFHLAEVQGGLGKPDWKRIDKHRSHVA
jgi:hypothetical protein